MSNIFRKLFMKKLEETPPKKEKLTGNFSDILIMDLEKKLGSLEGFQFLHSDQIKDLIKRNYNYVNEDSLGLAAAKIMLKFIENDFDRPKEKEDKINFMGVLLDYLKE